MIRGLGRRAGAMAALGSVAGVALVVGIGAPADAAVVDYRAYQQTLPASVIQGIGLDQDEETKVTSNTRTGVVGDKTVVPLKVNQGPRFGLIGAALSAVLYIDGQIESTIEFDRDGERPEWIDQEEWDACAPSGGDDWTGNFFDGLRDWTATFGGLDCNAVRDGWQVKKDDDYVPIGAPAGLAQYPVRITSGGTDFTLGVPYWSNLPMVVNGSVARQEGWVVPITGVFAATAPQLRFAALREDGTTLLAGVNTTISTSGIGASHLSSGPCLTATWCLVVSSYASATTGLSGGAVDWTKATGYIAQARGAITDPVWAQITPTPYVDPVSGTFDGSELARQVLLTSVTTDQGNVYQCRTVSFVT